MDKMILDMSVLGHGAGNIVVTGTSASAALPAGTESVVLACQANVHFRFTNGAGTAVVTDPMLLGGSQLQVFKLPANVTWTLSAIQDAGVGPNNLNYFRVYEG